jgi:voltage-gated potassium channel
MAGVKDPHIPSYHRAYIRDRWQIVIKLDRALEIPMIVLGLLWTALLAIDLASGLKSSFRLLLMIIWAAFILEFMFKFIIAPSKSRYLKSNWVVRISAVLPAFRILRIIRTIKHIKDANLSFRFRLARTASLINRSMSGISASMKRRSFGYVFTGTIAVIFIGAFALYLFERRVNEDLQSYGSSLWTTAMILTSIGSDFFPVTPAGRVLCFMLALYGYAVFGYFTAIFASYFYDKDKESDNLHNKQIDKLQEEISELKKDIRLLIDKQTTSTGKDVLNDQNVN